MYGWIHFSYYCILFFTFPGSATLLLCLQRESYTSFPSVFHFHIWWTEQGHKCILWVSVTQSPIPQLDILVLLQCMLSNFSRTHFFLSCIYIRCPPRPDYLINSLAYFFNGFFQPFVLFQRHCLSFIQDTCTRQRCLWFLQWAIISESCSLKIISYIYLGGETLQQLSHNWELRVILFKTRMENKELSVNTSLNITFGILGSLLRLEDYKISRRLWEEVSVCECMRIWVQIPCPHVKSWKRQCVSITSMLGIQK